MNDAEILQRNVLDELAWDAAVDSSKIGVTTNEDGVVTLTGQVLSYADKRAAENAVKRVRHVKAVANDLKVVTLPPYERDDSAIAEAAVTALEFSLPVPPDRVRVTVDHGWLTLEGEVKWQFQRKAAEHAVHDLMGVKGVTNLIKLTPTVKATDVQQKIQSAFDRNAQVDAKRITIEAVSGKVTLRGTVRSWAEKNEAEDAAWSAPGVKEVKNLIDVDAFAAAAEVAP